MTSDWSIKLRRSALSGLLTLFLANCQQTASTPAVVAAPPPESSLPLETIKSICLAWFNVLPTWQDSDAEQTKNEIDLGYRTWDEVCLRYTKGN